MICNYTNTIDLCCNKYSYSFINVIPSGTTVIADKSETSPVLRTDKSTLETKIISPSSNNLIPTCDINDDSEDTTDWECYIIYRYMCSGIISDPPLQTFKDAQIDLINTSYSSTLEEGILVTINSKNIILGSSINDQIAYKSILSYAQALYDDDTDASMPPFTDKNGQVYNLSYSDLIIVFKTYFEKVILYKNLKDTLINQSSNSSTIDNIQQLNWCSTKPLTGSLIGTKIVTTVDKPIVQSCIVVDTDTSGVDVSCDPPCDPESCEICVDGSCVSSCGQGECCNNGVCGECPDPCVTDEDCTDGWHCCDSECYPYFILCTVTGPGTATEECKQFIQGNGGSVEDCCPDNGYTVIGSTFDLSGQVLLSVNCAAPYPDCSSDNVSPILSNPVQPGYSVVNCIPDSTPPDDPP